MFKSYGRRIQILYILSLIKNVSIWINHGNGLKTVNIQRDIGLILYRKLIFSTWETSKWIFPLKTRYQFFPPIQYINLSMAYYFYVLFWFYVFPTKCLSAVILQKKSYGRFCETVYSETVFSAPNWTCKIQQPYLQIWRCLFYNSATFLDISNFLCNTYWISVALRIRQVYKTV